MPSASAVAPPHDYNDVLHVGLAGMGESAIVVLKNMKCKKGSEEYTPIKPISADWLTTGGWQVEGKNHEVVFVASKPTS